MNEPVADLHIWAMKLELFWEPIYHFTIDHVSATDNVYRVFLSCKDFKARMRMVTSLL